MDLREIGWEGMGWIYMAHDRIPRRARYWTFGFSNRREISWLAERTISFSRTLLHGVRKVLLVCEKKLVPLTFRSGKINVRRFQQRKQPRPWGFSWFSSVTTGKCTDSMLKKGTATCPIRMH
jgi:hypothetical protein